MARTKSADRIPKVTGLRKGVHTKALAVDGVSIVATRADGTTLPLTGLAEGVKYTTLANGGFAGCTIDLPGAAAQWRAEIPYLTFVRIMRDTQILYEGRVEDIDNQIGESMMCELTIFGLQRLFDDNTVHKAYLKRDLNWTAVPDCSTFHPVISSTASLGVNFVPNQNWQVQIGRFDPSDQTKLGFMVQPPKATAGNGEGGGAFLYLP